MALPLFAIAFLAVGGAGCEDGLFDDDDDDDIGDDDDDDDGIIDDNTFFSAVLRGDDEIPPVATTMSGDIEFALDGDALDFTLNVEDGIDIVAAHIHIGSPDENGPVVAFLFGEADPAVDVNGELSAGSVNADDLVGPLAGGTMQDLVDEMEVGNTYVNVHTVDFPDGEIRGQVEDGQLDEDDETPLE